MRIGFFSVMLATAAVTLPDYLVSSIHAAGLPPSPELSPDITANLQQLPDGVGFAQVAASPANSATMPSSSEKVKELKGVIARARSHIEFA